MNFLKNGLQALIEIHLDKQLKQAKLKPNTLSHMAYIYQILVRRDEVLCLLSQAEAIVYSAPADEDLNWLNVVADTSKP